MESEKYLELYYMESEAIARGFDINDPILKEKMPSIYSEEVFLKMIEIDIQTLKNLQNEVDFWKFTKNININENVNVKDNVDENVDVNIKDDVNENIKDDVDKDKKDNVKDEDKYIEDEDEYVEDVKDDVDKNIINIDVDEDKNDVDENIINIDEDIDEDEDDEDENMNEDIDININIDYLSDKSIFIVGDIHGSIIQLFAPLIKAKLIKNVRYDKELDKFEFDFYCTQNINPNTKIVYTGDIIYRGIHAHVMAMIEALIIIIQRFNYKIVNWVFGNHDMEFIKFGGVPRYTLNEYKRACPRFSEIHMMFCDFALNNPYKFGYALDVNISEYEKYLHAQIKDSDILITMPQELMVNNQILVTHTIQTRKELLKFINGYNKIFNTSYSLKYLNSDEKPPNQTKLLYTINQCFTEIVKYMLNSKDKYFVQSSDYGQLLFYMLWDRPDKNINYIDYGYKYHFIGHTPIDNVRYINTKKSTIILCDFNTFNSEYLDDCAWYSLTNFKNDLIISEPKEEIDSDDESEIETEIVDKCLENGNKLKFPNFKLKVIYNNVTYPIDMVPEIDKMHIQNAVSIYKELFN